MAKKITKTTAKTAKKNTTKPTTKVKKAATKKTTAKVKKVETKSTPVVEIVDAVTTVKVDKTAYPKLVNRRLEQVRFLMEEYKVDALVVTYLPNIRYLTSFSGSAATLFILNDSLHFVTDDRYEEQIKDELYALPNLKTHISRDPWSVIKKNKELKKIASMGFEADRMSYSGAVDIRNKIRPVKFKPMPGEIEPFTMPKAEEELESIKKACELAEKTFEKILEIVKPGMTEKELANEIAYQSRLLGSEGDPFDIICVSGIRGALVHGKPSDKKIKKNEIILLDFGCKVNGFGSDITRCFAIGKATKEQKDMYKLLNGAKKTAIENIRPGVNGKIIDKKARDIIKKAGFGNYFQHSLGHGIGLVAHEHPIITFRMDNEIIPDNSVIAIEPGVYLPDKFGMRIEDNVYVTINGPEYLTNAPEELPVIK